MQTLAIVNGDIALRSGSYATVTGVTKLRQDLAYALREPMGIDRFHPRWGSLLSEAIGDAINVRTTASISMEATRVIETYARVQQDKIRRDATNGKPSRFRAGEVIKSIDGVQVKQDQDTLHVRCAITTLSGDEVVLVTTVRV